MHAVTITQPGGPEVLAWTEVPDPVPGDGEVLIRVAASAVNRGDLLQRRGLYPPPPGASQYPGLECSGTIEAIGSAVTGWQVGDKVCALLAGGGYAELVAVDQGHVLPVPPGVSLTDAAALPEVTCTVWSNLRQVAGLSAGKTLLVHGGGSGIGTFAIQYANAIGATVLTTARRAKHEVLKSLGAAVTIDYTEADFAKETKAATDGRGADVILDIIGAAYLPGNISALAKGGHLVVIGMQGGRRGELDLGALLTKRASVTGTTLRSRPVWEKAAIVAGVREEVWPLIAKGTIKPVLDRTFPMSAAGDAHTVVDRNDHVGKVLLVP